MEEKQKATKAAVWVKKTKLGDNYLSGELTTPKGEVISFVAFKNKFKNEEGANPNSPDFRFSEEPREISIDDIPRAVAPRSEQVL